MNNSEKKNIYNKIISFLKEYDVNKISVFGSYVKDLETPASDIDILIEFSVNKSLLQFVNIEQKLSEYIGINVDLLTKSSISPYIYKNIENDIITLYQ